MTEPLAQLLAHIHADGGGRILGPDGLSRLTLSQAINGLQEQGYTDDQLIARIVDLYRDDWLARELAKPCGRHQTTIWPLLPDIRAAHRERLALEPKEQT